MELQTKVNIPKSKIKIEPTDNILLVGSCFAGHIGRILDENNFMVTTNPYGVMYNPASILHTVDKTSVSNCYDKVVFTLGTNHVYILNSTGEIVDNCKKRPQKLFTEQELTIDECVMYLSKSIDTILTNNPSAHIIITVSPIRYAKYGYHESQLSKATLLLAADQVVRKYGEASVSYFPAYELINDELRDYRFYAPDMLHPSEQAVEYIYECFANTYYSDNSRLFVNEWLPIKQALAHRSFNPESEGYKLFLAETREKESAFMNKWNITNRKFD